MEACKQAALALDLLQKQEAEVCKDGVGLMGGLGGKESQLCAPLGRRCGQRMAYMLYLPVECAALHVAHPVGCSAGWCGLSG